MEFTIVDGIAALTIFVSAILAYSRGFVREAMAIAGWVAATLIAYSFTPAAMPLIHELPYLGSFIGDSCDMSVILAFIAVFALALILVAFFTPLFSSLIRRTALGGVDHAFGFLFGALRGIIIVAIVLVVADRLTSSEPIEMIENSRISSIFADTQERLDNILPSNPPAWLLQKYDGLAAICSQ